MSQIWSEWSQIFGIINLTSIFSSSQTTSPYLFMSIYLSDLDMTNSLVLIKTWLERALTFSLPTPFPDLSSVRGCNSTHFLAICLSLCVLPGLWPRADFQPVHASLLVDGERPGVQGDTHHPSSLLGTWGPPIYIYIWLSDGFSVHRGGSLLTADTPGCKYLS